MASIADVYVTVLPETRKIKEGVRRAFREVDSEAREAGRRWGNEIDRGIGTRRVDLDANTTKARAEVRSLDREVSKTRSIKVDVDRSSLNGVATALRAVTTNLTATAVGVGGVLAPNAIASTATAVAQLSGAVGLLPATIGTAALAFGSLKVATLGFADALKEVRDPEKFAEAIAQLSPNMQQLATSIQGALPAIDQLKFTVQDAFGAGLGAQFQALSTTYLPMFQTVMSQMASSANSALTQVSQALQTPGRQADMSAMTNNMAVAFDRLSQALSPIVTSFIDIGLVGSGFMPQLADAAARAAQTFSDFIAEARATGDLQGWIDTGINAFRQLGDIVGNVGGIIKSFMTAAPEGGGLLGTLQSLTQIANDFLNSPAGQQALGTWMGAVQTAMTSLTPVVTSLLQALAPLASVIGQSLAMSIQAIAPALTQWFTAMQPVISQLSSALLPVVQQVAPVLGQLAMVMADQMVAGIQQILPVLLPFVTQMGQLLIAVTPLLPPMLQLVMSALPMMQQIVASVLPPLTQFATILTNLANLIIPPLSAAVGALADSFSTRFTVISTVVSTVWNAVQGPLNAMKSAIDALTQPLQKLLELAGRIPGVNALINAPGAIASGVGNALTTPTGTPLPIPMIGTPTAGGLANASRERRGLPPVSAMPPLPAYSSTLPVPPVSSYVAPPPSVGGGGAGSLPSQYESGMVPNNVQLLSLIEQYFPGVTANADTGRNDKYGEHGSGEALDIMVGANKALGDQINAFLLQNADALGLQYNIWQQSMHYPDGSVSGMPDRGSPTQNHMDHVHARVKAGAASGMPVGPVGTSAPISSGYPADSSYTATGDPATDKKLRDAQQKVADASDRVTSAQMRYDAVMAKGTSTTKQRFDAETALAKAKREHADAQTDLNTAEEKAAAGTTGKTASTGGEQLGQDILAGMGEVFGLGGLFKDPSQFGLMKLFKGVMGLNFNTDKSTGGDGSLFGGGGGGGGALGGILSMVPKAFGDLNIGSPGDSPPGQFMPLAPQSGGGGVVLPGQMLANPNSPAGAPGPGNQGGFNADFRGAQFGYSQTQVKDQVNSAHLQSVRQPLMSLPG